MMSKHNGLWWRCVVVAMALAAVAGCTNAAPASGALVDQPAPALSGTDLEGQPLRLADLRGRVVLVNFWATWCPPCLEEIPDLVRVAGTFATQGVQVVGANVDVDDPQRLAAFARRHGITYPLITTTPQMVEAYRLAVIPTSFLVDRTGVVRKRYLGPRDQATFARDIQALLQ